MKRLLVCLFVLMGGLPLAFGWPHGAKISGNPSVGTVAVFSENGVLIGTGTITLTNITLGGVTRTQWIDPTNGIDQVQADALYAKKTNNAVIVWTSSANGTNYTTLFQWDATNKTISITETAQ